MVTPSENRHTWLEFEKKWTQFNFLALKHTLLREQNSNVRNLETIQASSITSVYQISELKPKIVTTPTQN